MKVFNIDINNHDQYDNLIKSNNSLCQYGQPGIQEKLVMKRKLKIFLMNHIG